jgi:ATP-dependent helicase/nuclease subunit B
VPEIQKSLDERTEQQGFLSNIYSIPAECNFLNVLVQSLLDGNLIKGFTPRDNPLLLSKATIFVPNRRAARALSAAFMSAYDEEAVLLPAIRTLGDVGDEDFGIAPDASHFGQPGEEIKPLERALLLAKLVQHWVDAMEDETKRIYEDEEIAIPSSRADAILLAQDLSILLGQITQEETEWSAIQNVVPDNHAEWWKLTTTFLKIIMQAWPEHLKERGLLDPAERAARLLALRTEFYQQKRNKGPVIVAGSTGSVASTRRLLKAVASLDDGAVVLPGVDKSIADAEWESLSDPENGERATLEAHPQYGLAQLLFGLGVERENVEEIGTVSSSGAYCQRLLGLAMAPSDFTADWFEQSNGLNPDMTRDALSKVSMIAAGNERQEALAIAVAMREVLVDETKSAALITPDRNLARRVSMELQRFNITVDDTGGTPLKNSKLALFLRQISNVCFLPFQNSALAALLKNPLCCAGYSMGEAQKLARAFELVALRGVINRPCPGDFESFLNTRRIQLSESKYVSNQVNRILEETWDELLDYAKKLDNSFKPLVALNDIENETALQTFFVTLANSAETLSMNDVSKTAMLDDEGGLELKQLFENIVSMDERIYTVMAHDFPSVFDAILESSTTRPRGNTHPRLHIYGPLEVRLLEHDRVILAGLNEGTWPQTIRNDAFLNRLMRQELGMSSAERRTGLAAHDFQQLMGQAEVFLSRSSRVDRAPTVASRWVQRLMALVGDEQSKVMLERGRVYLELAELLDETSEKSNRVTRPCPTPPVEARPTSLAVTDIETWIRDPYALYAKRILKLNPVDPLEREPDPMLKGTLYHAIMQDYIEGIETSAPQSERLDYLKSLADEHIHDQNLAEDTSLIWKLRFYEIAQAYIKWEEGYHLENNIANVLCEIEGSIKVADNNFLLRARADRIDIAADGSLHIMDYKTGQNPSVPQAQTLSPQLALEGLIAKQGGFKQDASAGVSDLSYIRLRRSDPLEVKSIANKTRTLDDILTNAENQLLKLVKGFQFEKQGYISRRAPFKDSDMSNDYDHLARTREWSFGEDEDGDAV